MERRLWSAGAPVDVVPVADDREQEKHDRNQQQSGGFKCVNVVPGTATPGLLLGDSHENIVAPGEKSEANDKLRRFRHAAKFLYAATSGNAPYDAPIVPSKHLRLIRSLIVIP